MDEYLDAAVQIVRTAGQNARKMIHDAQIRSFKPLDDIVTDGDLLVEDYVIASLSKLFPDHGFDSEERGQVSGQRDFVWVLDPIDGTKYYARDVPLYCVSLALKYCGAPILGVVYSPELDRMYAAQRGRGATCNGRSIRCSGEDHLEKAVVCLEIGSRHSSSREQKQAMHAASVLVAHTSRVRVLGVAALGLAFCAAGGFDAYVNLGSSWKECDVAAGHVLILEAGGEWWEGGKHIFAGSAAVCKEIRSRLHI